MPSRIWWLKLQGWTFPVNIHCFHMRRSCISLDRMLPKWLTLLLWWMKQSTAAYLVVDSKLEHESWNQQIMNWLSIFPCYVNEWAFPFVVAETKYTFLQGISGENKNIFLSFLRSTNNGSSFGIISDTVEIFPFLSLTCGLVWISVAQRTK